VRIASRSRSAVVTAALVLAASFATPASPAAATDYDLPAPAPKKVTKHAAWAPRGIGSVAIWVNWDTGDKHMIICDYLAGAHGPGLQIDPSGTQAPLIYHDPDGTGPSCLDHHIGYSIRKMRFVMFNATTGGTLEVGDWFHVPTLDEPDT
jgi:hypothetical protein